MNKKKIMFIAVSAIVIIALVRTVMYITEAKYMSTFIAQGCSAVNYEQKSDAGYLTIISEGSAVKRDIIVKVTDNTLQNELSKAKLSDIIGVNLEMKIPYEVLEKNHIEPDTHNFNAINYLATGQFDEYVILLDVSYTELDNSGEKAIWEAIDNWYKEYEPKNKGELEIFLDKPLGVGGKRLVLAEKYMGDGHSSRELFLLDLSLNVESVASVYETMSPCFSIAQIFYEGKTILFGTLDDSRWIPEEDIVVTVDIKEVYAELENGENITERVETDKGFVLVLEGESNVKTFNLYNDNKELQAELSDVKVEIEEF